MPAGSDTPSSVRPGSPTTARFAGVLLAGGSSRRMGRPKAALRVGGRTFAACALELLRSAGLRPLVVVAGEHFEQTRSALPTDVHLRLLRNPCPERGQLHSLKIALRSLDSDPEISGAMVTLVDHPLVQPGTAHALLSVARTDGIAVPCYRGRRGHPVVFGRELFSELLETADEAGARAVVRRLPARVTTTEVEDPGILRDIDTPGEYARLSPEEKLR